MSTPSVTILKNLVLNWESNQMEEETIATFYRHYDGYPSCHAIDIANSLVVASRTKPEHIDFSGASVERDILNNRNWCQHFLKAMCMADADIEFIGEDNVPSASYTYVVTGAYDNFGGKVSIGAEEYLSRINIKVYEGDENGNLVFEGGAAESELLGGIRCGLRGILRRSAGGADQLVDDRLIVSRGVGDLFVIALAHHDLIGDGDVGGVAGVTGLLDVLIGLAVDDLLALIANGMVGGLVLIDGCHVLRVSHCVMVDGLVGDRPVVGVRLLFALRAVFRRRVGTAFLGIIRLHGFGLGICTGLVADAIIGTAADERDEGKAADGGDDLPVVWLLLAFRVCLHVVLIRRRFGGIPVVHLDIVLFIFIVLHGCIPLSN